MNDVPFVSLYDQLSNLVSTLTVSNMKAVEHEDNEDNNNFSVDPLADPRLDKMDLYNLVDSQDRDKIMSAQSSFAAEQSDYFPEASAAEASAANESTSDSGSGE